MRSLREVEIASQHGIKTVITDHHQPWKDAGSGGCDLSEAGRRLLSNKDLAGVGIAYKWLRRC